MGTLTTIQPSFAAGEVSPFLYGRVDLAKFHVGARTMENFFVHPHGGASNRPGTRFVGEVDDSAVRHRLIPFQFRASPGGQNYALVFGHLTMQVVMLDAGGIPGFVESSPGAVYTTASPYAAADLPTLKFVQSADTMTLTHPLYAPRKLTRAGHASWSFATITFAPATAAPTALTPASAGSGGSTLMVTAINDATGEESLASAPATSTISTDVWTWGAVTGCTNYFVYKQSGSVFGFIAQVTSATFTEPGPSGLAPDIGNQPSGGTRNPFSGAGNWPQCTAYYLQRQAYGGSTNNPQGLFFSTVGAFNNMNVSTPTKDSDAIDRTLVGQQVNEIRHLVPTGTNLMLMTSGAEWRCYPGPSQAALTPAQCFTLPQTAHGSSHVPPIWTQNSLLFVKERGSRVIELRYDAIQDLYQSLDMSVLASHLLYDTTAQYRIEEWAWASEPFQIAWGVRSDGVLLGFTFMREHEVYAWHRHITDGLVESVCAITEPDGNGGYLDAVYLIVNRTIGGATRRYVERLAPRTFATIADAWFLDCALQYDGVPVTTVSGLDHLEGKTVAILGDGSVVPSQVVTGGAVTLDGPYSKVTVGLPYTARLESLNLEVAAAGGTMQGNMKKIAQLTVRVKDSRGLQVGLNQGATQEVKQRTTETLGTAMQAYSGDWAVTIPSEWNTDGRIFAQQVYPLPATILDLIPKVNPGG